MTDNQNAALHADEADIVRWLDGALPGDDRRALETHVASCAECLGLQRTLARRSVRISNLLRMVDVPAPAPAPAATLRLSVQRRAAAFGESRLSLSVRWRVAAVLALALGGAAAVPPVRAWVVGMAKSAWALASGAGAGGSDRATADSSPAAIPGAVAFTPVGTVLTIRAPARTDAKLTVEVVGGDRVSAVGSRGQALPGLLVLPNELRIEANNDAAADYLVRVPLGLKTVRIVVGAREVLFRPSAIGQRQTFSLAP